MPSCIFIFLLLLIQQSSYAFDWKPDQCSTFQVAPQSPIYGHSDLNQSRQLDQGDTGTCYLHVTKQLLEQYHDPKLDFSLNSLLDACPIKPDQGGQVYSVLHNMRRLREKIRLYKGNNSEHQISECNLQDHNGNPLLSFIGNQFEQIHDTTNELNKNYATLDYNFNIHVQENFKVNHSKLQETIEEILQSTKMPIALTIEDHVVTLVGTADVCCDQKDCKKRVLIRNSWGVSGSGWYDAEQLNLAMSQDSHSHFTFLKRCNSTKINIDDIEKCNSKEIYGEHSLGYLAASNDPLAISKLLLKNPRIDLNQRDNDGDTPAFVAAYEGHDEVLKVLAEHGADLNKPNNNGTTLAYVVAFKGQAAVLKILAKHGADLNKPQPDGATPAFIAAENGHTEALKILAEHGADLNKPRRDGRTPAYIAAQEGQAAVLKILVKHGADLNIPDSEGTTPAYIAADQGHAEALKILVEHGADLNIPDNTGTTPTYVATYKGHAEALKILVKHGANLNIPDNAGSTPAYIAAYKGHPEALKILAEHGADLNIPYGAGITPAYIAAYEGHAEALKILAEYGADLNIPDSVGTTPAYIAAYKGQAEALKILAEHGADLNKPRRDGATPAAIAAKNGHTEILKIIKQYNLRGKRTQGGAGSPANKTKDRS